MCDGHRLQQYKAESKINCKSLGKKINCKTEKRSKSKDIIQISLDASDMVVNREEPHPSLDCSSVPGTSKDTVESIQAEDFSPILEGNVCYNFISLGLRKPIC